MLFSLPKFNKRSLTNCNFNQTLFAWPKYYKLNYFSVCLVMCLYLIYTSYVCTSKWKKNCSHVNPMIALNEILIRLFLYFKVKDWAHQSLTSFMHAAPHVFSGIATDVRVWYYVLKLFINFFSFQFDRELNLIDLFCKLPAKPHWNHPSLE